MKTLAVLLLLYALSFGQTPLTKTQLKAQKQDCTKATKAFKKATSDPALSQDDFKILVNALDDACGLPQEYATATSDCENAIAAVNQNVEKNGPDPTLSRTDLKPLLEAMHRACGMAEDTKVEQQSAPDSQPKDSPRDIHGLVAEHTTALNREIALGNRLIAHFQKAQTWEGIDADHPEAVALREKIAQEEKELRAAIIAGAELSDRIDMKRVSRECTVEEIDGLTHIVQEATGVMKDVKTQQDRYHALGY